MNIEKTLCRIFHQVMGVDDDKFSIAMTPDETPNWNSIGHMQLVLEIEKEFGISLVVDEIMEMDSVEKIIQIIEDKIK